MSALEFIRKNSLLVLIVVAGVGLGLALSRDIARSIGGDLVLEKSSEKGTVFTLSLPLS